MSSLTPKSEVLRTTFWVVGLVLLFVAGLDLHAHGMSGDVGIVGGLGLLAIFIAA